MPDTAQTRTATITFDGKSVDVPVYDAVHGPSVLDIRRLYAELGVFTYDPGFTSTGSCE
ncbi:MAG: citrate (Si)-synthase, partial [Pseudomonadota bacterium]